MFIANTKEVISLAVLFMMTVTCWIWDYLTQHIQRSSFIFQHDKGAKSCSLALWLSSPGPSNNSHWFHFYIMCWLGARRKNSKKILVRTVAADIGDFDKMNLNFNFDIFEFKAEQVWETKVRLNVVALFQSLLFFIMNIIFSIIPNLQILQSFSTFIILFLQH